MKIIHYSHLLYTKEKSSVVQCYHCIVIGVFPLVSDRCLDKKGETIFRMLSLSLSWPWGEKYRSLL